MLLQRVTRKSLYRFRTSLGGSSSAGCLSQHFVIMRIRLIPIKRNQKTGRKKKNKKPPLRIILNTLLSRNTALHTTTIPTLHATPTHTTLTHSTLPHCTTSHTPLPLHTTPTPRYINTPIPTHATHSRFIQQGFSLSLHMLYSTTHRNLYLRLIYHTAASPVTQYPVSDYQKKKFTLPHFNQGVTRPRANARKQQTNTEPHTSAFKRIAPTSPRAPTGARAQARGHAHKRLHTHTQHSLTTRQHNTSYKRTARTRFKYNTPLRMQDQGRSSFLSLT